jgi:hypothetical protein
MEHLEVGYVKVLSNILQGQIRRRYRMENELLALWKQARSEWMLKPNPPMMYSTQEWVGQVVTLWDGNKPEGLQTLLSRVIKHNKEGWSIITDIRHGDLPDIANLLDIPLDKIPDIYLLDVDGQQVWLHDPMNHFWRDPCDS